MMITVGLICEVADHVSDLDAVIFDLDDTLYPEKDYVRCGYRAVSALFPNVPDMAQRLWAAFEDGRPAIDAVLEEEGLQSYKAAALEAYRQNEPVLTLYPGARELLRRLGERVKLGIITDGRPEGQRAKLRALCIEPLFDEIIVTDELGGTQYRKPDPTAFRLMSERLGTRYDRMAYVGDNIRKDFIAPEALGMRCIWFQNPDGLYYRQ